MEVKRIVQFDERRKILSVVSEQEEEANFGEVKGGTIKIRTEAEYNEDGIKEILKGANGEKTSLESQIPVMQNLVDKAENNKEEIEKFKDMITIIQRIQTPEQLDQIKKTIDDNQKRLKQVQIDMAQIKDTIGTRMNFNELNSPEDK